MNFKLDGDDNSCNIIELKPNIGGILNGFKGINVLKFYSYLKHPGFQKFIANDIIAFETGFKDDAEQLLKNDLEKYPGVPKTLIEDRETIEILNIFEQNPEVKKVVWLQLRAFPNRLAKA